MYVKATASDEKFTYSYFFADCQQTAAINKKARKVFLIDGALWCW